MLTGESLPVNKHPGDEAIGGTVNMGGPLQVWAPHMGSSAVNTCRPLAGMGIKHGRCRFWLLSSAYGKPCRAMHLDSMGWLHVWVLCMGHLGFILLSFVRGTSNLNTSPVQCKARLAACNG